jgi:hypothetical protein
VAPLQCTGAQSGAGPPRCWPPGASQNCSAQLFPDATSAKVRQNLERGMREFVELEIGGRIAIYWITPKTAHSTLMKLFLAASGPWKVLGGASGHDAQRDCWMHELYRTPASAGPAFAPQKGWLTNSTDGARELEAVLQRQPFEFTFVRDPLSHLVSAAGQQKYCLTSNKPGRKIYGNAELQGPSEVTGMLAQMLSHRSPKVAAFNTTDCAKHMFTQGSGYAFEGAGGAGVNRLHFVGRVESLNDDYALLLRLLLGESSAKRAPRAIATTNGAHHRSHRFASGSADWRELAASPLARRYVDSDRACFGYPPYPGARTPGPDIRERLPKSANKSLSTPGTDV